MSTIEKLSIQGIRSFGPHAEDLQSITFTSPVTLILGENGCGKTTVIECIKYALTGDSPPGSDRGKSFVHDPKIFSLSESMGQIKIQVRDKRGSRLSVCRSMRITHRRGKLAFETLDSTMNFLNGPDGDASNKDSISRRCADVDVAMCEFMGVSKAIINNVLFCHQEDSSWPLDESKKLKEKFDAIFGITEYNKAMEKIIKMRKEEMGTLKVMEAELKLLVQLKNDMDDMSLSLENSNKKCEEFKQINAQYDEEIRPIDDRLNEIRQIENETGKYQARKVEADTKLNNCRDQITSLGRKVKKRFEGTLCELEFEIRTFDKKMSEKKQECNAVQEGLSTLRLDEKSTLQKLSELEKKQCLVKQQQQKEQQCKQKYAQKVESLCGQLEIEYSDDLMENSQSVSELMENIQGAVMSKLCEIEELANQFESDDHKSQEQIDALRVDVTKSEEGITSLQKQKASIEKESNATEEKINNIDLSMHQLKALNERIQETDTIHAEIMSKFDQDMSREVIANGKVNIDQLQKKFQEHDERLTFLNSIGKLMAEINLKQKDLDKKEQEVRRVKSKHSDNFGRVFSQPVSTNYRRSLQIVYEKLRRDIKDLNDKLNAQKLSEQSFDIKRKNLKNEIVRAEKELEESKETVYETCHSTPYEELLVRSKAAITKLQLDHGALKSAEAMYKKYIQKIEENPCCPLCHKDMSGNEASDLSVELTDEIQKLPENISSAEKTLKAEQKKFENLLQIKPVIEKVNRLANEIPKQKEELRRIQDSLSESANEHEMLQMLMAEPTSNMELANSMMGDMSILDEALKEITRISKDIEDLKRKLPDGHDANDSIDTLQAEKNRISKELENERKVLESNQQDYEKQMDALNRIREMKNKLKDKQIKLQEGLQSLPQLKERYQELTQSLIATSEEINELKSKIHPLKQNLNSAISEKARQKEANRQKLAKMQSVYNTLKSCDDEIERLNKEVIEFKKMELSLEFNKLQAAIKAVNLKLSKLSTEIGETTLQLDGIKTECLNQETLERDLKDNRELKLLQQSEIKLNEQCQALAKQLGNLDFRSVSQEKSRLIEKQNAAIIEKNKNLGKIGEIKNQIQSLERSMEDSKYKNSLQNYRRANYEVQVTRRVIDDLGQHRVALEWSLIQFHAEKMEKINRLIREYWRMIYRGNDIDYIQIKTDEISTEASADRKRSYNYRVVQSKNGSEIEMRGRCSAGQRVLASLIIRMALAETFSSNCGVLALDEPTTNLDRFNIGSLCDALNRITEERQAQSNFMLVIITHDEEFISALGKIHTYHRVFRNDECKSVIRRVKIT